MPNRTGLELVVILGLLRGLTYYYPGYPFAIRPIPMPLLDSIYK